MSKPGRRSTPSARQLAVRTLREIEQRQGFSNRLLSEQLERHLDLDPRDRALATNLVYGVLRQQTRLDALIDAFAHKPKRIKGELRTILRVAAYELVELDRPLAIASAEAAKLTFRLDPQGLLKGLIAGILQGIDRDAAILDVALQDGDPVDALERRWSLPRWLAARWVAQLGPELARARAKAIAEIPAIDLRVDLGRISLAELRERLLIDHPGIEFLPLPESVGAQPQALRVRSGGDLFHGPLFGEGLFTIQSLGSQQAVRTLDPRPGERVLDACAGMGTKTLQIAELMQRGTIVAVDASSERLAEHETIRERGDLDARKGLELRSLIADLALDQDLGGPLDPTHVRYDAVLLDAPCTGLGNLARHPELRWTCELADVTTCAALQATLLRRCASLVASGGRLVYAVCSLEPEEGPAIVHGLLADPAFVGQFTLELEQAWTPERHQCDGFWLARLRRV
ncbi:transcription antitermination factor NusB [Nannocystaceae bacterium ST9]